MPDIVPSPPPGPPGFLDKLIETIGDFNVPKFLAGPAGEAISKLVAGATSIPEAWLDQKAQAIRDKTKAKSLVSDTIAGAAADLVKNDPALAQRAAEAFISKEISRQYNREAVAVKAVEHLNHTPDAETKQPDDDWLNVFSRYAEDASTDRMRELWGRVLSGQLLRPQSFSLQTLRFVSELDAHIALLFEKWARRVVDNDFIPFPPNKGREFTELLQLEDFGLITGLTGNLSKMFNSKEMNLDAVFGLAEISILSFQFRSHHVVAYIKLPFNVNIRAVLLTRIARELLPIIDAASTEEIVGDFVVSFPKQHVQQIEMIALVPGSFGKLLWTKPPDDKPQ